MTTEERLERDIDTIGLTGVLDIIADICHANAKARRMRTQEQDDVLADVWETCGARIEL